MQKKYLRLSALGLLLIAGTNIVCRYLKMSDYVHGMLLGIGLGIMLLALYRMRSRPSSQQC